MAFSYDATGIRRNQQPVPEGDYLLRIVEAEETTSKAGDPQVVVTFAVAEGEYSGRRIPFHRVTFKPKDEKGAWVAVAFLRAIGQPNEGEFIVDSKTWIGATVHAEILIEEFNGRLSNKVQKVKPAKQAQELAAPEASADDLEEVSF